MCCVFFVHLLGYSHRNSFECMYMCLEDFDVHFYIVGAILLTCLASGESSRSTFLSGVFTLRQKCLWLCHGDWHYHLRLY